MPTPLAVYLRNHEAAGHAGHDLSKRVAASHRRQPYAPKIVQLVEDIGADLHSLQAVMKRHRVQPDQRLTVALRVGERVGRLKPNGALLRRAPLTDLIEIEGLLAAVRAKAAGWQALAAAADSVEAAEFETLLVRADAQAATLVEIHRQVAAKVLSFS